MAIKFSSPKADVVNALRRAYVSVEAGGIEQHFGHFLFDAKDDGIRIQATNGISHTAVGLVPKVLDLGDEALRQFTVPAWQVLKFCEIADEGDIAFDVDPNARIVRIEAGNTKFDLQGIDPLAFPEFNPGDDVDEMFEMAVPDLIQCIDSTRPFVCDLPFRYDLHLIEVLNSRFIAGDGSKLIAMRHPGIDPEVNVRFPKESVGAALAFLKASVGTGVKVRVSRSMEYSFIENGNGDQFAMYLTEAEFDESVETLIEETGEARVLTMSIDRGRFERILERVRIAFDNKDGTVKFTITPGDTAYEARMNVDAVSNAGLPLTSTGIPVVWGYPNGDEFDPPEDAEAFEVAFQYKSMADAVKAFEEKTVSISVHDRVFRMDGKASLASEHDELAEVTAIVSFTVQAGA